MLTNHTHIQVDEEHERYFAHLKSIDAEFTNSITHFIVLDTPRYVVIVLSSDSQTHLSLCRKRTHTHARARRRRRRMRKWKKQMLLRVWRRGVLWSSFHKWQQQICSRSPSSIPALLTSTPKMTMWTPESIKEMATRWCILDETKNNIINVSQSTSNQILAVRVQTDDSNVPTNKKKGPQAWRLMQRPHSKKLIIVPKSAPASRLHWLLDEANSRPHEIVTWHRAGAVMKWVPLPSNVRKTTVQQRADRRVSILTPVLSPKPRKRRRTKKICVSYGCQCALKGDVCKKLRLGSDLPSCDPRLAKRPSTNKVR